MDKFAFKCQNSKHPPPAAEARADGKKNDKKKRDGHEEVLLISRLAKATGSREFNFCISIVSSIPPPVTRFVNSNFLRNVERCENFRGPTSLTQWNASVEERRENECVKMEN